jgi:hypothetical protein
MAANFLCRKRTNTQAQHWIEVIFLGALLASL